MKLIGTLSTEPSSTGWYTLITHGLPIPVAGVPTCMAGKRICVHGTPKWTARKESFFMVYNYCLSTKPDKNFVTVEGTVTAIFPERINARNRRSVCLLLQQTDRVSSTVLVTALSSNVDALHVDTLTIGTHIRISGYISYHGRGLHVLYMRTLDKEENANAGQIPEPEHCV